MGKMTPPSRKSCYNFRVTEVTKVVDGDTIDVVIDLGFDIYKHERVRIAGIDTPEKRTRDLEEKALGIDATNWMKYTLEDTIMGSMNLLYELNSKVAWVSMVGFLVGYTLAMILSHSTNR